MICTIVERARCLRWNSRLPKDFWAKVVLTSIHLINISLNVALNGRWLKRYELENFLTIPFYACLDVQVMSLHLLMKD